MIAMDRAEAIAFLMGEHPDDPARRPDFIKLWVVYPNYGDTYFIDPDIFEEWMERHGYEHKRNHEWIGPQGWLFWASSCYIIRDVERRDDTGIAVVE